MSNVLVIGDGLEPLDVLPEDWASNPRAVDVDEIWPRFAATRDSFMRSYKLWHDRHGFPAPIVVSTNRKPLWDSLALALWLDKQRPIDCRLFGRFAATEQGAQS